MWQHLANCVRSLRAMVVNLRRRLRGGSAVLGDPYVCLLCLLAVEVCNGYVTSCRKAASLCSKFAVP
uniref:Putative secreted protein n=1 Tax=Rhipicephalus microplus TaxID=6941 RepID=A0A6G5A457_RHIMP